MSNDGLVSTWLIRAGALLIAGAAAWWSLAVLPVFACVNAPKQISERLLYDDHFKASSLLGVSADLDLPIEFGWVSPEWQRARAIISLYDREEILRAGGSDFDKKLLIAYDAAEASLRLNPNDAFLWMMLFSLENDRRGFDVQNLRFLKASYYFGPFEGWISLRRNKVSLATFHNLDVDTQDIVVSEFAAILDANLIAAAEDNLVGVGWPYREKLIAGLEHVDAAPKQALAKMLSRDGIKIGLPGLAKYDRPW